MSQEDYQKYLRKFIIYISLAVITALITGFSAFSVYVGSTSVNNSVKVEKLEIRQTLSENTLADLKSKIETKMDRSEAITLNAKIIADMDSLKRLQLFILMNLKKMK